MIQILKWYIEKTSNSRCEWTSFFLFLNFCKRTPRKMYDVNHGSNHCHRPTKIFERKVAGYLIGKRHYSEVNPMDPLLNWLMSDDVSLQYLTSKYLLHKPENELAALRKKIAADGWGKAFLGARKPSGHWGRDFYQVKWISSHYTLLDLRHLEIEPTEPILETLNLILRTCKSADGSINESHTLPSGDLCVNGMFLNYASFFGIPESELKSVVDFILDNIMPDGGFNCNWKRGGSVHGSMHTTISVLEGLWEFQKAGYDYRTEEIEQTRKHAESFLLKHKLFKSDKTGEIIDKRWCMLSFPSRWRYDITGAGLFRRCREALRSEDGRRPQTSSK